MAVAITADNFSTVVLNASKPVVIDVYASWCPPCQQMAPIFEELEKEHSGKYAFAKLNVDEAREISIQLEVSSVPTFVFFKNGQKQGAVTGSMSKEALQEKIVEMLG